MIAIARGGPLAASTVLRLNAIGQMLSLVNARGGSVFAMQDGVSAWVNPDRSGGQAIPGGAIGAVANLARGLGFGPGGTVPGLAAEDATQATALNKPTAGNSLAVPGLREISAIPTQFLQTANIAGAANEFIAVVAVPNAVGGMDFAGKGLNATDPGAMFFRRAADGAVLFISYNGSSYATPVSSAGVLNVGTSPVLVGIKASARTYLRVNGIEVASQSLASVAGVSSPFLIGRSPDAAGYSGTILMAVRGAFEPTAAEFAVIERGLAAVNPIGVFA